MGTTLQGKKIKDTYKSIIKVTDNGEAGSTGKQLSDGNGNDLGIYVDTDGVLGVGAAASVAIDASSKTDAIQVPNGTTAQRPTAGNGMMRYNSTLGKMEYYDGAWKAFAEGDIESVVAGNGLTGGATDGNATVNVVGGTGITVNADDVQISDDGVDHDQLANRYTALSALGTGSSFALNFSNAATFTATANANATFTFSNAKQGQVIDLIVSGNFTITFSETGSTFNKVGGVDYDGSSNNLIQIVCTDETSGSKIYHYSVATYESDSSPS